MDQLLGTTDCLAVERMLLEVAWNHWTKLAEQYFFSFEAVLLYLARWEIINRWISRDAVLGRQRFEQLVTESLDEYAQPVRMKPPLSASTETSSRWRPPKAPS